MPSHLSFLLLTTTILSLFSTSISAGDDQTTLTIYNDPKHGYVYHGCYNETTDLPGTVGNRALYGGTNRVLEGSMTVDACQVFCKEGGYRFAGLEYSKECWCAQSLSTLSERFDDGACDLGCDGNKSVACGGVMKLSVYTLGAGSVRAGWIGAVAMVLAAGVNLA